MSSNNTSSTNSDRPSDNSSSDRQAPAERPRPARKASERQTGQPSGQPRPRRTGQQSSGDRPVRQSSARQPAARQPDRPTERPLPPAPSGMPSITADRAPAPTRYFAFGSNLWLEQMASRCPNSPFVGIGRLRGWKWFINERGFANIRQTRPTDPRSAPADDGEPEDEVWGMVYDLSEADEAKLDRNEGVPKSYQKETTAVDFYAINYSFSPANAVTSRSSTAANTGTTTTTNAVTSRSSTAANTGTTTTTNATTTSTRARTSASPRKPSSTDPNGPPQPHSPSTKPTTTTTTTTITSRQSRYHRPTPVPMLIYVDNLRNQGHDLSAAPATRDAKPPRWAPRDEYVARMNGGIADALRLGVPERYVRNVMRKYIPPPGSREAEEAAERADVEAALKTTERAAAAGADLCI